MKLHTLKIKIEYLKEVIHKRKTFELRKDDRDYQVGDLITFTCVDDEDFKDYRNLYEITYILRNVEEYGLSKEYCIFGIKELF